MNVVIVDYTYLHMVFKIFCLTILNRMHLLVVYNYLIIVLYLWLLLKVS